MCFLGRNRERKQGRTRVKKSMKGMIVPLLAGILAGGLPAWTKLEGSPKQHPAKKPPSKVTLLRYSLEASRRAFSACDLDRDDRITFREARTTLGVATPEDFGSWDTDHDGWVHFPEFDKRYRKLVRQGWGLTLLGPAAARAPKDPPPPTPLPLKKLFRVLDRNRDGRVAPAEWKGTSQALAATLSRVPHGFFGLDRNRDGTLELREMTPLLALFPDLAGKKSPANRAGAPRTLPLEIQGADRNGDQHLDLRELQILFQKMDPGLVPWAKEILRRKDKNQDGLLSPRELRSAPKPPAGQTRARSKGSRKTSPLD